MMRAGLSDEDIAARYHMTPDKVREAIQNFDSARASVSNDIVDVAVNTEALIALDGIGDDLRETRNALRFTGAYGIDGNPIFERDHNLILESAAAIGSLVDKVRPKGGGVQINTAIQNNGNGNGSGGSGQGRSFEAMLREAKAQRALTDGGVAVAETVDAEFEDEPIESHSGVELDDPDDAGVDEEMDNGE